MFFMAFPSVAENPQQRKYRMSGGWRAGGLATSHDAPGSKIHTSNAQHPPPVDM